MDPEDRPSGTGSLLAFTLCVAALTLSLWIAWASWQDRGLFAPAADHATIADADMAAGRAPTGR